MNQSPWDEPTTLNRDDLPREPVNMPHRHPDTDLRPFQGLIVAVGFFLVVFGFGLIAWGLWGSWK